MTNTKYSHIQELIIDELHLLWQDGFLTRQNGIDVAQEVLNDNQIDNVSVKVHSLGSGEFNILIEEK